MKASEARELALKNDKHTQHVRDQIYKFIEQRAKSGIRGCEVSFGEHHDKKAVIKGLRADGYKVGCDFVTDPRDGSYSYNYRISW